MKTIDIHQVDAFTDTIFGGNPAGVVTNADELAEEEMAKIAREMNLSETAFVLKPTEDGADVKLRYFTPETEVAFCGHATVGTLYELSRLSMFNLGKPGQNTVHVETGAGVLEMSVTGGSDTPRVTFAAPTVAMEAYQLQDEAFATAFGISANALRPQSKIFIDTTLKYLYIPVASLDVLGKLKFDFDTIRANFAAENIVVFCLYTNETFDQKSDLHARVTGPLIGISEDPFTGSTQAGLVYAAKQTGMLDSKQSKIVTEQGNFVGRPGFAEVSDKASEVLVTANAAQVFSTKMEL